MSGQPLGKQVQAWGMGQTNAVPLEYLAFAWMRSFPAYTLETVWNMTTDDLFTSLEFLTVEGNTHKPLRYT